MKVKISIILFVFCSIIGNHQFISASIDVNNEATTVSGQENNEDLITDHETFNAEEETNSTPENTKADDDVFKIDEGTTVSAPENNEVTDAQTSLNEDSTKPSTELPTMKLKNEVFDSFEKAKEKCVLTYEIKIPKTYNSEDYNIYLLYFCIDQKYKSSNYTTAAESCIKKTSDGHYICTW
ncbi:uncharacterized protein LOC122509520 [Leptopilina heterotoma]|uniref:uncharacterized protein LOC122509520 n=1 Tax=Leptopilina heterotoma TaxID=63436 RepID=UPI001CA7E583|nr:uncharacterized protein LOC122509520 [Leptopilina heterotoma]